MEPGTGVCAVCCGAGEGAHRRPSESRRNNGAVIPRLRRSSGGSCHRGKGFRRRSARDGEARRDGNRGISAPERIRHSARVAMSRHQYLAWLCLAGLLAPPCRAADLEEIVRRATATLQSDWSADADYAYIERDEVQKNGTVTSKTSQVVYIAGSDYYLPLE